MNEIPAYYRIPDGSEHQADVEAIIAAIGAYEAKLPFPDHHHHSAQVFTTDEGRVMVGLVRTVRTTVDSEERANALMTIREGIEDHFDEADRERLASYWVKDPMTKA